MRLTFIYFHPRQFRSTDWPSSDGALPLLVFFFSLLQQMCQNDPIVTPSIILRSK